MANIGAKSLEQYIPPKRITEEQYDILMRELWEMKQKIACFNIITKHQEDLDALYEQNAAIIKEQKTLRKMAVKIGTALFKKATNGKA